MSKKLQVGQRVQVSSGFGTIVEILKKPTPMGTVVVRVDFRSCAEIYKRMDIVRIFS